MQEYNNYTIPLIPFYLVALLIAWSLWKKKKWLLPALLALSFSSVALIFLIVRDLAAIYGNAEIGFAIAMYASPTATIPLVGLGWFIGNKVSKRMGIIIAVMAILLNFFLAFAYRKMVNQNAEILKTTVDFDCSKVPYHCAIRDHRLADIPALKKSGMDIEAHDSSARTALWYGLNDEEAVRVLLENGANPDSFNSKSETPLIHVLVVSLKPNLAVGRLLLKHGAQINRTVGFRKKISILNFAIVNKNIEVINLLLENGADPLFKDGYRKDSCERLKQLPRDQIVNLKKYCPSL